MGLSNQTQQMLPGLLRIYRKFLPEPKFRDVLSRPQDLQDIPPDMLGEMKSCIVAAIRTGMPDFLQENIELERYSPFSEAVASQVVGKIDVNIRFAVKIGGEELKRQINFIEKQETWLKEFYPSVQASHESGGRFVCIMDLLSDYDSFHDMVFRKVAKNKFEIAEALDCIMSTFTLVCQKTFSEFRVPNLFVLYVKERIMDRVAQAQAKLEDACQTASLLDLPVEIDGVKLEPYSKCMAVIKDVIEDLAPNFTTLVHGDAHPGNIMIRRMADNYIMKFLDPNPYIEDSDYLYDIGKMIHWLDKVGLLILERQALEQVVEVDVTPGHSLIAIKYHLVESLLDPKFHIVLPLGEVEDFSKFALDYMYTKAGALADALGDKTWQQRLNLSLASAYLGGLVRLEEPAHLTLVFVEGLRYLNKLLFPKVFG